MTARLRAKITPVDIAHWSSIDPLVWIAESVRARNSVYPASPKLSYAYVFQHKALLGEQLEEGGVRLAARLNALFAGAARISTCRGRAGCLPFPPGSLTP